MTVAHPLQIRSLTARPTITWGQCCDLKLEDNHGDRWWLCRLAVGDTPHRITIEQYNPNQGGWTVKEIFTDPPEET